MLKNVFAAVSREQQIVMFFDDVRDARKRWIKGSYNDIRSCLFASFVCKVTLRGMSAPPRICLVTKLRL